MKFWHDLHRSMHKSAKLAPRRPRYGMSVARSFRASKIRHISPVASGSGMYLI